MSGLRCAYLVSRYPSITHAFVLNEVRALRDRGAEIHTLSIRRVHDEEILTPEQEQEHARTHAILPVSPARLATAHLTAFARAPRAYLATLGRAVRMGPEGARNRLWQLFYFAESILLWVWLERRELRHVHVHHANVSSDVALLCVSYGNASRRSGRPWTWSMTLHGPTELLDVKAHKLADKACLAERVVCISDFARSQLMSLTPATRWDRFHTVRCGVDRSIFHPPDHRGDPGRVTILTVAAMSRRKGHAVLLDALAELARGGSELRALLVGDGEERAALERQAVRLGIGDLVEFPGALGQDALPGLYREADVFCLPSYAEGVPVVLMEAMASGVPVVATRIMGVPELVEDESSGLLVPPGRADALAHALGRLVRDGELRARLGRAGRERVADEFDLARSAAALDQLLSGIAAS